MHCTVLLLGWKMDVGGSNGECNGDFQGFRGLSFFLFRVQ